MVKKLTQDTLVFSFGGIIYGLIEILWRQRTHWTMLITGGLCFLILFRVFLKIRKINALFKCIIGSVVITTIELAAGCIVNLKLKMNVWDYSSLPFNLCGQICPRYSMLWAVLTIPIMLACTCMEKFLNSEISA